MKYSRTFFFAVISIISISHFKENIVITHKLYHIGGVEEKIPTYFAANQSNQDQIEQTPVLCRKCLLEATKLLIFKQKKTFNMSFFLSTLERSDFFCFFFVFFSICLYNCDTFNGMLIYET